MCCVHDEVLPTIGEDQVQDNLRNLNVHKSMGRYEMYPWVLREMVEGIAKPQSIIFEKSWQMELPGTGKGET